MALEILLSGPDQGVLTLHLQGRLDSDSADSADETLSGSLAADVKTLVLDLAGLDYMSSAGIRSLFTARMMMEQRGGRLVLLSPQAAVRKVLDMVRIVEAANILDSYAQLEQTLA